MKVVKTVRSPKGSIIDKRFVGTFAVIKNTKYDDGEDCAYLMDYVQAINDVLTKGLERRPRTFSIRTFNDGTTIDDTGKINARLGSIIRITNDGKWATASNLEPVTEVEKKNYEIFLSVLDDQNMYLEGQFRELLSKVKT